jgi:hypothetical protein
VTAPHVEVDDVRTPGAVQERPEARFRARRWRLAGRVVLVLLVVRALTPGIQGILTNDSVGYLTRAKNPFALGFVVQGYRQAAYPLLIQVMGWLDPIFGFDNVFAVALVQRVLLVVGIVLLWGALRWWALPLLLVVSSTTFVMHTDYVLTEGLLVPLCLIAAALTASVVTGRGWAAQRPWAALLVVAGLGVVMGALKLQYAVLLLLACSVAWVVVRDDEVSLRRACGVLVTAFGLVVALAGAQAVENHHELGAWEPVAERGRAEWYGAWEATFVLHPENRARPELTSFYDRGNLYTFLHGLETSEPDYAVRQAALRERVEALFEAAGTSRRHQEVAALLGAVRGGRMDDIAGITNKVRTENAPSAEARRFVSSDAPTQAALDAISGGRESAVLTVEPLTGRLQDVFDDYRPTRSALGILALLLAVAGAAVPGRHRAATAACVLVLVAVGATLASGYIDNARYLVGPMTVSLVGATLSARAIALARLGGTRDVQ